MAIINGHNVYSAFGDSPDKAYKTLQVLFPQAEVIKTGSGSIEIKYKPLAVQKFNSNLNNAQVFLDNKVIIELQKYVSLKYGFQMQSIRYGTFAGSGKVHINVPYAEYQAYSKRIRKRVGLRGTYPWERMVADKKSSILRQVAEYSKGLNKYWMN